MRRVFGASKKKDPPPTVQDATDRVLLLRIFFFFLLPFLSDQRDYFLDFVGVLCGCF